MIGSFEGGEAMERARLAALRAPVKTVIPSSAREQRKPSTSQTPAALGYRMPAEWEPHVATWVAWPHNRSDWPGKFAVIPWVYAEVVRQLARVERVAIIVEDAAARRRALQILTDSGAKIESLDFYLWPTNRGWTRDCGPIFLVSESRAQQPVAITSWSFNAWAKYKDWQKDATIAGKVARLLGVPEWRPTISVNGRPRRVVLEGGSIDVNGRGTMLTTEECLLSSTQQRNPGLGKSELEQVFADYVGVRRVIWLGQGIAGDDTHGHVDDIARFAAPDTVVACVESDTADPNHEPLADNLRRLRAARDQDGAPLRVIELPMPGPVVFRGQRLPASYANFYIANRLVLVPTFNDPNDRRALEILAGVFCDREVVGIYCGDLVWGLGTLHCMTQQQPEVLGRWSSVVGQAP
ncbi:MAG TPA: agmatine deiminase family protein [Terriglobales bacterium]|nr:agmatine deiminase family protein [Terriglobales bacterium]